LFGKEIKEFSSNLESLRDFIELVDAHLEEKKVYELKKDSAGFAPLILAMHKDFPDDLELDDEKIETIQKKFGSDIKIIKEETEDGETYSFELNDDGNERFNSAMERLLKTQKRTSSLHQSSLVTIISYVEWFLAQLIHKYYDKNPNAIGLREKQLSLNDLYEIGSIDDAKKFLIDTKVESILRGSLNDWVTFLKDQIKLSMSYLENHKSELIEACQRRNLYVHNGGVVNSIYLKNCHFEEDKSPEIGESLSCNRKYIEDTLSAFEKSFLLIAAELWKKNEPENRDRFQILNHMSYEHICGGRYDIASSLAFFLQGDKKQKESDRMKAQINYWQARKWADDFESVRKDIEEADFSAKDTLYILSRHTLLDEFDEAFKLLPELIRTKKLSVSEAEEWPLFKKIRVEPRYDEMMKEFRPDESQLNGDETLGD